MSTATVRLHESRGSVWAEGDLVAGWESNEGGRYTTVLCVEPREVSARGVVHKPARMAEIIGASWDSVIREIRNLGFNEPRLTAEQVRYPKTRRAPNRREQPTGDYPCTICPEVLHSPGALGGHLAGHSKRGEPARAGEADSR